MAKMKATVRNARTNKEGECSMPTTTQEQKQEPLRDT